MANPNTGHPAAPIYRLFSGGVEPDEDEYELDSKTWATWRRYRAAFNSYCAFCEETGVQPFPASAGTVRPFVRHVVKAGGAVVSCDITRQVIMMVHKLRGYPPVVWDSMDLFYQGVRRRHGGPRRQAQPLRAEDLQAILGRLDPASSRGARDGAILALGWAGALRSEEITRLAWDAPGIDGKGHIVTRPAGVEVHFRRTKTDQTGREAQQVIIPAPDVPLVMTWLDHWQRVAGRVPGRFTFSQVSRCDRILWKPMAPTGVTAVVRRRVLDFLLAGGAEKVAAVALASSYRSHSLRSGYATSAAAGGVVEAEIREHCRHKSAETTAGYIRPEVGGGRAQRPIAMNTDGVDLRLSEHPGPSGVFCGSAQLEDAVVTFSVVPPQRLWQGYTHPVQRPDPTRWSVYADGSLIARIERDEDVGPALLPLLQSAFARASSGPYDGEES